MTRDSCRRWLKREIGFEGCEVGHFLHGAFGKSLGMVIFKTPLLIYWTSMWIYRLVDFHILSPGEKLKEDANYSRFREYPDYMTNWGDTINFLYLFVSTIVVYYGEFSGLFDLRTWLLDFWCERKNDVSVAANPARFRHYVVQLLMEIATMWSIAVTGLYFIFLGDQFDGSDETNVHAHVMNGKSLMTSYLQFESSGCYVSGVRIQPNPIPTIPLRLFMLRQFDLYSRKLYWLSYQPKKKCNILRYNRLD